MVPIQRPSFTIEAKSSNRPTVLPRSPSMRLLVNRSRQRPGQSRSRRGRVFLADDLKKPGPSGKTSLAVRIKGLPGQQTRTVYFGVAAGSEFRVKFHAEAGLKARMLPFGPRPSEFPINIVPMFFMS